MSKFNINSEDQLRQFLQIVAEEAYKKSLSESNDPFQERILAIKDKDERRYGSLDEEEAEEGEEEAGIPDEEFTQAQAEIETSETQAVSFDSVKKAINNLRAGTSIKGDTESSLNVYYDRLDDNERLVLYTFLDELSKILNLKVKGDDAQDPGDPPISMDFVSADEEADQQAQDDVAEEEPAAEAEEADAEDTTPPIAVNESQDKEAVRRKIRILMSR
jgi:hypothetical protein